MRWRSIAFLAGLVVAAPVVALAVPASTGVAPAPAAGAPATRPIPIRHVAAGTPLLDGFARLLNAGG